MQSKDEPAVETEPVTVEQQQPEEPKDAPAWMLKNDSQPASGTAETPKTESENNTIAEIGADAVATIHHRIAEGTGYEGWETTEKEYVMWCKVIAYLLRKLPVKDYPMIVILFSLITVEGSKVAGYVMWRRNNKKAEPPGSGH